MLGPSFSFDLKKQTYMWMYSILFILIGLTKVFAQDVLPNDCESLQAYNFNLKKAKELVIAKGYKETEIDYLSHKIIGDTNSPRWSSVSAVGLKKNKRILWEEVVHHANLPSAPGKILLPLHVSPRFGLNAISSGGVCREEEFFCYSQSEQKLYFMRSGFECKTGSPVSITYIHLVED